MNTFKIKIKRNVDKEKKEDNIIITTSENNTKDLLNIFRNAIVDTYKLDYKNVDKFIEDEFGVYTGMVLKIPYQKWIMPPEEQDKNINQEQKQKQEVPLSLNQSIPEKKEFLDQNEEQKKYKKLSLCANFLIYFAKSNAILEIDQKSAKGILPIDIQSAGATAPGLSGIEIGKEPAGVPPVTSAPANFNYNSPTPSHSSEPELMPEMPPASTGSSQQVSSYNYLDNIKKQILISEGLL